MLQFVREIPIRISIQGTLSSRRGFLFYLAAGFAPQSGAVDPLSGMSVNLTSVDQWLASLKQELEGSAFTSAGETLNHGFADLMAVVRLRLTELAEQEGVRVVSLAFREERGWSYRWNSSMSPEQQLFSYSQFLELVPAAATSELLKVELEWLRAHGCEFEYQHEGLMLMKTTLGANGLEPLLTALRSLKGRSLPSGTRLNAIRVHVLAESLTLEI